MPDLSRIRQASRSWDVVHDAGFGQFTTPQEAEQSRNGQFGRRVGVASTDWSLCAVRDARRLNGVTSRTTPVRALHGVAPHQSDRHRVAPCELDLGVTRQRTPRNQAAAHRRAELETLPPVASALPKPRPRPTADPDPRHRPWPAPFPRASPAADCRPGPQTTARSPAPFPRASPAADRRPGPQTTARSPALSPQLARGRPPTRTPDHRTSPALSPEPRRGRPLHPRSNDLPASRTSPQHK